MPLRLRSSVPGADPPFFSRAFSRASRPAETNGLPAGLGAGLEAGLDAGLDAGDRSDPDSRWGREVSDEVDALIRRTNTFPVAVGGARISRSTEDLPARASADIL